TSEEFGGSEWAHVVHRHRGGMPRQADAAAEQALAEVLIASAASGLLDSAHDLSEGGLAQALAESCLRYGVGARVGLPDGLDPFVALFSEAAARALVAVRPDAAGEFRRLCAEHDVPATALGEVADGEVLEVRGRFSIPLEELRTAWTETFPRRFDG